MEKQNDVYYVVLRKPYKIYVIVETETGQMRKK